MKRYFFMLILFTFLVYVNSFGNDFVWDDLNNVVNNKQLEKRVDLTEVFFKTMPNPPLQFYRPIPFLSIMADHLLWSKNPFGYHLTNFLLHLFNVIFIFFITSRLTNSHLTSFTCALLFAIHPIHTEAVTYISGRSDSICVFFLFVSFLLYLKSLSAIKYGQLVYSGGSLLFFLFGLLSKEIAVVFPFIIFAYDRLYLNSPFKVRLKKNMPFFIVMTAFLILRHIANNLNVELSLNRILLVPKILLYYIRLLVLPINLHMQHSLQESPFLINLPFILSALIFAGFIFIVLRLAKKRAMRFGLVSFLIGLAPFSGIIKLNAEIAEHWLYFASFGFFLFASGLFVQNKLLIGRKVILSILILFFSILTLQRNAVWRDDVSIYQDALKYRPDDPKIHYNLGNAYLRRDLIDKAAEEYSIAIEQNPNYAYALNNLGLAFEKQGDIKTAYRTYKKAAASDPGLGVAKRNFLRLQFGSLAFAQESSFDHGLYGKVLAEFVDDGEVDYAALKSNSSILNKYLKEIAELNPSVLNSMPRNDKTAFYLNIYNALTLKAITDYYPVRSIRDIPGVWDRIKFMVAGGELTLNQIEHEILRKEFKEPRIHFALVCASKSCPELAKEPFSGRDIDLQLDREARKFINDRAKVKLDKDNNVLYLSSIFKWFKEDFGDVIGFISKYLPEDDAKFIKEKKPKIRYLNYDWSLNEKL